MKKIFKAAALTLILTLASAQVISVQAYLTEEEQEANRKRKESEKLALSVETESEEESETLTEETQESAEAEIPVETETETEVKDETESESEIETESETEAQTETESEDVSEAEEEAPLVVIDPGKQKSGKVLTETEPNGPGSDEMRTKMSDGAVGCESGVQEYELNLKIALKLKEELQDRGYRVLLTRESSDVNLSEAERSQIANEAGADIYLRLHANESQESDEKGALTAAPSESNPYVGDIYNSCMKLADDILNAYCEKTGLEKQGIWVTDKLTGTNWSEMPVTLLKMGYLTNPEDDSFMSEEENQDLMVEGIADGVDIYFRR